MFNNRVFPKAHNVEDTWWGKNGEAEDQNEGKEQEGKIIL